MQDMKRSHLDKGGLASAAIADKDQLEGRHVFACCHLDASTLQLCNGRQCCSGKWWRFPIGNDGIRPSPVTEITKKNNIFCNLQPEEGKYHTRTSDTVFCGRFANNDHLKIEKWEIIMAYEYYLNNCFTLWRLLHVVARENTGFFISLPNRYLQEYRFGTCLNISSW